MPHVTFVHGIDNKPTAEILYGQWLRGLSIGGFDLRGQGVTSKMVYWADVLYEAPLDPLGANVESVTEESLTSLLAEASDDLGDSFDSYHSAEERAFLEGLSARLDARLDLGASDTGEDELVPPDPNLIEARLGGAELFSPWVTKLMLRAFVRDAHHYLFDVEHEPRPGERYRVRSEIRDRTVQALEEAPSSGPHIIVGHSLGSVIAYDVLQRVEDAPAVDGLLTLGSPLGISEIQDQLRPEWTRAVGFPVGKLRGWWVNVYDPLDLVCLLGPRISNDYRREGEAVIEDVSVNNGRGWRHSYERYAQQSVLTGRLKDLLSCQP